MTKQVVSIGNTANDRKGDSLRAAFTKINSNFDELYASSENTSSQTLTLTGDTLSISGGNSVDLNKYVDSTFSGSYNDLTDKPTIPADISDLTDTESLLGGGPGDIILNSGRINNSASDGSGLQVEADTDFEIKVVGSEDTAIWSFEPSGNITFPDATIQYTAWTGSIDWASVTNAPTIPANINDLSNVALTSPADGDFLMYANGEWINAVLLNNIVAGSNISLLNNDAGYITLADVTGEITVNPTGDLKGSVFADDSTLLVDGTNGTVPGTLTGSWNNTDSVFNVIGEGIGVATGSTSFLVSDSGINFANTDNSENISLLIGSGNFSISASGSATIALGGAVTAATGAVTWAVNGTASLASEDLSWAVNGPVTLAADNINIGPNGVTANLIGNTTGYHTGDMTGSVFADDSTLLVDGVAGKIVGPVDTASVTFPDDTVQTTAYIDKFVNRSTFTADTTVTPMSANLLNFDAYQGSQAFDGEFETFPGQWTADSTGLYRLDFVLGLTQGEVDLDIIVFLYNVTAGSNQIKLFDGIFTGSVLSMSGTTYLTDGARYQFGIIQTSGSNIILDKDLTSVGIEQLTKV